MDKQKLAAKLWATVSDLRGNIESYTYKDYILGLLFYKFLTDKEYELLSKGFPIKDEEIVEITEQKTDIVEYCKTNLVYFIEPKYFYNKWLENINDFTEDDLITSQKPLTFHLKRPIY